MLENCTLNITQYGAQFTKGKFSIVRDVTIDILSSTTDTGVTLGDGSDTDDMNFELYPACTLNFSGGA